jgi:uncharacterized membrane protein YdjX (TVP38/TMEM64 family)
MLPGTVMYVYLGSLAQAGSGARSRTTGEWILYGVGLLATIGVTIFDLRHPDRPESVVPEDHRMKPILSRS